MSHSEVVTLTRERLVDARRGFLLTTSLFSQELRQYSLTVTAVLRAQCAEIEQLHAALHALDVARPSEMRLQVSRPARLAEAVLRSRRSTAAAALQ